MKKMSKGLKKQLINISVVVVLIAVTLLVLLLNYKELNFANISEFFSKSNPWYLTAAFACMLLFILFEALSLFFIVRGLGYKSKMRSSIAYSSADTYYSAITPSASGGQPASAFYMTRDGMGAGRASFALLLNLVGYTSAILVLGVVAAIINPGLYFSIDSWYVHVLVIFGIVMQVFLFGFFISCMYFGRAITKVGNGLISLLTKIRIVKRPEKWRKKLLEEVDKFRACRAEIKKHPIVIIAAVVFNVLQRTSQTLISCFVCYSACPTANFGDLFVMQVLVVFGYNTLPLPGGVGAYELLYMTIYTMRFSEAFIIVAMMISRLISFYCCIAISGVYTLTYHIVGGKKKHEPVPDLDINADIGGAPTGQTADTEEVHSDMTENAESADSAPREEINETTDNTETTDSAAAPPSTEGANEVHEQ